MKWKKGRIDRKPYYFAHIGRLVNIYSHNTRMVSVDRWLNGWRITITPEYKAHSITVADSFKTRAEAIESVEVAIDKAI